MQFNRINVLVLAIFLSPLKLLAGPVELNSLADAGLSQMGQFEIESCLQVLNSDTALQAPANSQYGWKVEIRNTCSTTLIVQVDFEWFDATGNSLGIDSDAGIVIDSNATAIGRSIKQLAGGAANQNLVKSHAVTLHSVETLENSVASCLRITSTAAGVTKSDMIGHYSWRADIKNNCNVDLFTTVQFRPLTANGYPRYPNANGPPLNKEDIFVPANGSTVAHNLFKFRNIAGYRIEDQDYRLVENSIPEYSNVRIAIREKFKADFFYDPTNGLLTIPLLDDLGNAYEVTFLVVELAGQFYYLLDIASIHSIAKPPGVAAQFSSQGILKIPSVASNDASVVQSDLVLELINPWFFAFKLASYNEPSDALTRFGYSLDNNYCLEIESVDSALGALNSGAPGLLWTVEVSNKCALAQEIKLTFFGLTNEGLILHPFPTNTTTELVPAQSIRIFTGAVPTAAVYGLVGKFASELVKIEY